MSRANLVELLKPLRRDGQLACIDPRLVEMIEAGVDSVG
jgi:hypothetical protein